AVLPDSARAAAGGTVAGVGAALERQVGRPGIYAIIVGSRFEAGSNVMPGGEAASLASVSFAGHRSQGPLAVLTHFVSLAANADPGPQSSGSTGAAPSSSSSSNNTGIVLVAIIGSLVAVIALLLLIGGLRRRARTRRRMAEVRKVAREDQIALGDDIR